MARSRALPAHCSQYTEAVKAARARTVAPEARGVPLETIRWRRIVVDEVHIPYGGERADAAARELLGVGTVAPAARPLRMHKGGCLWGLSGTPLLTQSSVTEFAALCGAYISGGGDHWRALERASARTATLRGLQPAPLPCDHVARLEAAQSWLDVAASCKYSYEERLEGVQLVDEVVELECCAGYAAAAAAAGLADAAPAVDAMQPEQLDELLDASANAVARAEALGQCIDGVAEWRLETKEKLVVACPAYAMPAARRALNQRGTKFVDSQLDDTDALVTFADEASAPGEDDAWLLLLLIDDAVGLNLQHVSRFIVFFAPVWRKNPAEAAAAERQAIGRVYRPGQAHSTVHVARMLLGGADGQTIDAALHARNNTDEAQRLAIGV